MLGDTLVDWLDEGGQTVDMRALWESRVRLLTPARSMILTAITDHDDRAAVHQGNVRRSPHGPM